MVKEDAEENKEMKGMRKARQMRVVHEGDEYRDPMI
jgi:hypothetical protein